MSIKPAAIVGQVVLYGAFAAFIGYFATDPRYQHLPENTALIKLSISHFGDRECRKRTPEELEKLPRNMRNPMDCPRERSPINIVVDIDGKPWFNQTIQPTGIAKDGIATTYKRLEVPSGEHMISVKMNHNNREPGFQFVKEDKVTLKPAQVLVIDFNPDKGGLFFQ